MENLDQLYIEILKNDLVEIPIRSFNGKYEPLDLISRLEPMIKLGLVDIDWKSKKIKKTGFNHLQLLRYKKSLSKEIGGIPANMKQEKININEPYTKNI